MEISFLVADLGSWSWLIVLGSVVILAGSGALILILLRRKKTPVSRPVDESAIDALVSRLGGIGNILEASLDGARLKFTVRNVDACDLTGLRCGGALGIFVSGNAVKFMLTGDSDRVVDRSHAMKKGETS